MSSTQVSTERRRYRRIPRVREAAVFEYVDASERRGTSRGRLRDVSAGGAAILVEGTVPPKDATGRLTVYFEGFQLVSDARVTRSWSRGFAVAFLELDSNLRDAIDALPDEQDPPA